MRFERCDAGDVKCASIIKTLEMCLKPADSSKSLCMLTNFISIDTTITLSDCYGQYDRRVDFYNHPRPRSSSSSSLSHFISFHFVWLASFVCCFYSNIRIFAIFVRLFNCLADFAPPPHPPSSCIILKMHLLLSIQAVTGNTHRLIVLLNMNEYASQNSK